MVDTNKGNLKFIPSLALAIGSAVGAVMWIQPVVAVTMIGKEAIWLLPLIFIPLLLVLPSYITLSKIWPVSPGHYYYPSRLLFPENRFVSQAVAFAVSWSFVFSLSILSLQLLSLAAAQYLHSMVSLISTQAFSTGILLSCLAIAWFGIQIIGRAEVILSTILLLLSLISFIISGFINIEISNIASPVVPPIESSLMGLLLLSTIGTTGLYLIDLGNDIRDAKDTVWRVMVYSCSINLTIVALITLVIVGVGPNLTQLTGKTIQYIALAHLPSLVVHTLAVGAMIAGVTTIIGMIPIITRHLMAHAADGILPHWLTKENKHGEAGHLIIFIAIISAVMINSGIPINTIATTASIIHYFPLLLISIVGIRIPFLYPSVFEKEMTKEIPILRPGVVRWSSIIATGIIILMIIGTVLQSPAIASMIAFLLPISGIVVYGIRWLQSGNELSISETAPIERKEEY